MNYFEFCFNTQGKPAFTNDIIIAFLAEAGFESFDEENRIVKAYIQQNDFNQDLLDEAIVQITDACGKIPYTKNTPENKNWNAIWESDFEPVTVNKDCIIRAPFHEPTHEYTHEIIIEPKMSFGTGHHETTWLMIHAMLQHKFTNKSVADCGCGTGILAIMAAKLGATNLYAFDYDERCYENTLESIKLNNTQQCTVECGGMNLLENKSFSIILANINRNIIIQNLHIINQSLSENGLLFLSGFYEQDRQIVEKECLAFGLKLVSFNSKNKWAVLVLSK